MAKAVPNSLTEVTQFKALTVRSVGWLGVKRILTQVIQTGSSLILVRLLFPSEFGIFAIISFIVTLSWSFADLGLSRALVQRKGEPEVALLRSVWWTQLGLGLVVAGVLWALAPLFISYYSGQLDSGSIAWLRWLALSQILVNMGAVSGNLLERHLNYGRILASEILVLLSTQVSTISFALGGFGVASFIFGNLIGKVVGLISVFLLSPWSWGVDWRIDKLKPLLHFGIPFQMASWVGIANGAVLPVFIGRFPGPGGFAGSEAVGFVSWAGGVAAITTLASGVVEPVIFPLMSRLQDNLKLAQRVFERMLRVVSVLTFGGIALLIVLAPELIKIVFIPRWLPALPSLRLATFQMGIIVVTGLALSTLLAFGEARFFRNMNLVWAVLQWILTPALVLTLGFWGFNLAGIAVSGTALYSFWRLRRYFKISTFSIIKVPIVVSLTSGLVILGLRQFVTIDNFSHLLLFSGFGGLIYLLMIYVLMRGELHKDIKLLIEIVGQMFRKAGPRIINKTL